MENQSFHKKLIQLVLPITFQNFMFALVPVADTMMLVRLEQDAMSAVSLAAQVNFVLNLFIDAVSLGASMLIAQYWGKKDMRSVEKIWGFSQLLMLPVGILFFLAGMFFPDGVMRIFTSEMAIISFGIQYLRIVSISYLINSILKIVQIIMKNTGQVKTVTYVSSAMVILNIVLNAIFIYGYFGVTAMGVKGAALATMLSAVFSLLAVIYLQCKGSKVRFRMSDLIHIDKKLSADFAKYASPILANEIVWGIGFTMNSVIMGHLGSDAVAANSILMVMKNLIACFCFALGSGGAILVGNELGAGRLEDAKEFGRKICHLAILSGFLSGALILFGAPVLLHIVNLTPEAGHYLKWMMAMCLYYMVGKSVNSTIVGGIFCAGGDTTFGFICDTIAMWGIIIPVALLAAFVIKLPVLAVFFILNLDEMIKLPVVYRHYIQYKWVRNLTRSE